MGLEKQKVTTTFRQLRQVLKEAKSFLLSRINWLGKEISKGQKFYVTSTETQLNYLRKLTDSLKSRQCLPPGQLLQVSVPWGPSCKNTVTPPWLQIRALTTWQDTRVASIFLSPAQCCPIEILCEP